MAKVQTNGSVCKDLWKKLIHHCQIDDFLATVCTNGQQWADRRHRFLQKWIQAPKMTYVECKSRVYIGKNKSSWIFIVLFPFSEVISFIFEINQFPNCSYHLILTPTSHHHLPSTGQMSKMILPGFQSQFYESFAIPQYYPIVIRTRLHHFSHTTDRKHTYVSRRSIQYVQNTIWRTSTNTCLPKSRRISMIERNQNQVFIPIWWKLTKK